MSEIVIKNQKNVEDIIEKMKNDGGGELHVLADFDRTMTKGIVNGKTVPSIISILRDENYLTPDYPKKAHALFDKYHPIEIDPNVSIEDKKIAMDKWWMKHFELLIESGLSISDTKSAIKSARLQLRDGAEKFILNLDDKGIPLVIMSASGLGREVIEDYLKSLGLMFDNVYIISNQFKWDQNGRAVSVIKPIVHGFNKDETLIKDSLSYEKVINRKNVILIGDSIGDAAMADGFEYNNLLKIGFLDEEIEKNRNLYMDNFDIVVVDQGGFEIVNEIFEKINV